MNEIKKMKEASKSLIVAGMFVSALYAALIVCMFPLRHAVMILFACAAGVAAGYCAHLLTAVLAPGKRFDRVVLLRDWVWISLSGLLGAVFATGFISLISGANMDLVVMGNVAFWLFLVLPITYVSDVGLKLAIDKKVPAWMGEKMSDVLDDDMTQSDDDDYGFLFPYGPWTTGTTWWALSDD